MLVLTFFLHNSKHDPYIEPKEILPVNEIWVSSFLGQTACKCGLAAPHRLNQWRRHAFSAIASASGTCSFSFITFGCWVVETNTYHFNRNPRSFKRPSLFRTPSQVPECFFFLFVSNLKKTACCTHVSLYSDKSWEEIRKRIRMWIELAFFC